jgi:hypothetical protein
MTRLGAGIVSKARRLFSRGAFVAAGWLTCAGLAAAAPPGEPAAAASAPAASPANPSVKIEALAIGFGGKYKVGFWTPVEVTLFGGAQASRADLRIIVPDGDGAPTEIVEPQVGLSPGSETQVRTYVKFGRQHAAVRVVFGESGGVRPIAERTFAGDEVPNALLALQHLIVEVGTPLDLSAAARFIAADKAQPAAIVHLDDPGQLPDRWYGLDGVDFVVLTTGTPGIYRRLTPAVAAALERWLTLGGRVILSVGGSAAEALAPSAPLARFAPGRLVATIPLHRFGALENFAGTSDRFDTGWAAGARPSIDAVQLADVRGHVEAYEGNLSEELPLVVRRAVGFGQLVFVAVDIDSTAFRRWSARPQFLATLLDRNAAVSGESPLSAPQVQGLRLGFDDMAGQLRTALDQYPEVRITPFWLASLLALAYILILFPLDYLLSRRRTGHSLWPWIRFAAIVVGASVGVWFLGRQGRENRVQINQVDVVDFDAESRLARGTTWFGLYSPRNAEYSIAAKPEAPAALAEANAVQLSWFGLPGDGFGGMNFRRSEFELPLFDVPYRAAPDSGSVEQVPLAAWSSKCFTAGWSTPDVQAVQADLYVNADRQLAGTIRLANNLSGQGRAGQGGLAPFELTDCHLFYDRWAYGIPHFSDTNSIDVDRLVQLTAETLLTQRKTIGGVDMTSPYDRAGLDRESILEIMMSYRAAGGRQYTGLWDRYQQFLDLSDLLALDRAILIGVGPPAVEIQVDGQPIPSDAAARHVTFYRFVLPVRNRSSHP